MEVLEEGTVMGESNSNNKMQTQIVKGKRTKRQRPQSPIPFRIPPAYSPKSDHASSRICSNIQHNSGGGDDDDDSHSNSAIDALRPTSSSDEYYTYGHRTSEEEEEMANCLILLAQGQSRRSPPPNQATVDAAGCKFTSRKFMETGASTETGKVGCHVYECKTCSKTFPSFQALGGHRASHKKPKAKEDDEKRPTISSHPTPMIQRPFPLLSLFN
ncbi:hypothetical protein Nepgr_009729 [Nepenthes gracilis]|uniref:C2H2-type domain-containing protein n=1 Tax=Nepenthes gracilis TaxID=150966 RepID=A0AAD3XKM1_NEPGR|nr:hypothetical protein Nepgr_009729 [Nepenthes gracilis]